MVVFTLKQHLVFDLIKIWKIINGHALPLAFLAGEGYIIIPIGDTNNLAEAGTRRPEGGKSPPTDQISLR